MLETYISCGGFVCIISGVKISSKFRYSYNSINFILRNLFSFIEENKNVPQGVAQSAGNHVS